MIEKIEYKSTWSKVQNQAGGMCTVLNNALCTHIKRLISTNDKIQQLSANDQL